MVTAPRQYEVQDVAPPSAGAGQVVVEVHRVGVCGTDVEFFTGEMPYLHDGQAEFPMRLGHEWCGVVVEVGAGVDRAWVGRRVTGDTMLGCGTCRRCQRGTQHVCAVRFEIGIRGGFPGALAERLAVPVTSLHELPDAVDDVLGALVEPGGNALRAVWAAGLSPGDRVLVLGPGTIGLLVALFAQAQGAEVHLLGADDALARVRADARLRRRLGGRDLPDLPFDAVIDASNAPSLPARALDLVEPGKRVVYIGLAGIPEPGRHPEPGPQGRHGGGHPQRVARAGRHHRAATPPASVDPRPLVAATVGLDGVGAILAGERPPGAGPGPRSTSTRASEIVLTPGRTSHE